MSEPRYHLSIEGQTLAGLTEDEVRTRLVADPTGATQAVVWREGWSAWMPATQVFAAQQRQAQGGVELQRLGPWLVGACGVFGLLMLIGALLASPDDELTESMEPQPQGTAGTGPAPADKRRPKPMPCRATTEKLYQFAHAIDGSYVEFEYDAEGRLHRSESYYPSGAALQAEEWEYAPEGARVTTFKGMGRIVVQYERHGDAYLPKGTDDPASGRSVRYYEYAFDKQNRAISSRGTVLDSTELCTLEYNRDEAQPFARYSFGETRATCDEYNFTDLEYDDQGRLTTMTRSREMGEGSTRKPWDQWRMTFEYQCR